MAMSVAVVIKGAGYYSADVIASADADQNFSVAHEITRGGSPAEAGPGGLVGGNPPAFVTFAILTAKGETGQWTATIEGAVIRVRKGSTATGSGDVAAQIRIYAHDRCPDGLVEASRKAQVG